MMKRQTVQPCNVMAVWHLRSAWSQQVLQLSVKQLRSIENKKSSFAFATK